MTTRLEGFKHTPDQIRMRLEGSHFTEISHAPVPFINQLLKNRITDHLGISPGNFVALATDGKPPIIDSFLRTQATRVVGDLSGVVARTIGICTGPDQVLDLLVPIAQKELVRIKDTEQGGAIKQLVDMGISNIRDCDPKTVIALTKSWGNVVRAIKYQTGDVDTVTGLQMHPLAYQFAYTTRQNLEDLKARVDGKSNNLVVAHPIWETEIGGRQRLSDIRMGYFVPQLTEEQRELLMAILPSELNRTTAVASSAPIEYLKIAGMTGHPLVRELSAQLEQKQQMADLADTIGRQP